MKKIIVIMSMLVIFCIAAGSIIILVGGRDIDQPDIADLIPEVLAVPEEQNGFFALMAAADAIVLPPDLMVIIDYLLGETVDDTSVANFLAANLPVFDSIKTALQFEYCRVPEAVNPDYPEKWHYIGILLAAQAAFDLEAGLLDQSAQGCLTLIRFGEKILADARNLADYNVGITFLRLGLDNAGSLARSQAISVRELNLFSHALRIVKPLDRGLIQAFQYRFQTVAESIDQFRSSGRNLEQTFEDLYLLPYTLRKTTWFPGYLFKENKTKQTLAELYRNMIENVPRTFSDMQTYDIEQHLGLGGGRLGFMVRPNFVGRMFFAFTTPEFKTFLEGKCQIEGTIRATQLIIALRSFEKKTGRLPDQLTQLCPDFLREVPLDPFDGQPFRYSKTKQIVYSVGKDLEDSEGSTEVPSDAFYGKDYPKTWIAKDAVFRLK